jgi:hypothetical protein
MNRKFLVLLTVISLMAGYAFSFEPIPDATPETFLGGPENLALVNAAKTVRVFRVRPPNPNRKADPVVAIDKMTRDATPVEVAGPEVPQVIATMSNMAGFGQMLTCDFDPGIILRFEANGHILDVLICFHCHEMILYRDGELVHRPFKWAETRNTFTGDARRAFLAIAKKAFPNDAEIQKLAR